jgi:hypothetical protein
MLNLSPRTQPLPTARHALQTLTDNSACSTLPNQQTFTNSPARSTLPDQETLTDNSARSTQTTGGAHALRVSRPDPARNHPPYGFDVAPNSHAGQCHVARVKSMLTEPPPCAVLRRPSLPLRAQRQHTENSSGGQSGDNGGSAGGRYARGGGWCFVKCFTRNPGPWPAAIGST